jgi:hypothetical protein
MVVWGQGGQGRVYKLVQRETGVLSVLGNCDLIEQK